MKYRRMGDSDVSLSEIAFGCGGNAGLMTRGEPREQERAIARAHELGVNYFDNAPDYGAGLAETNLGRALKALRIRPIVNSKVEVRAEDLGDIAGHVVKSVEDSLSRLGLDTLDVVQIHNGPADPAPKLEGKVYRQLAIEDFLRPNGAMEGLRRVLDAGKARHAGFICRGDDIEPVTRLLDTGMFKLINVPYSPVNPTPGRARPQGLRGGKDFGGVINVAQARGVGVAIYSPLAGGILTEECANAAPPHPLARVNAEGEKALRHQMIARSLRPLGARAGLSLPQVGYRFILDHPGVTTALGGFSSAEQIEQLVSVTDAPGFNADEWRALEVMWARDFAN